MKKLIYLFSIFFLSTTFLITSCSDKKDDKTEKDNCFAIILDDLNKDPRPEVFAAMDIPSNEDIALCICSNLPDMKDEELIEWVNEDVDPLNEENKERIEFSVKCMGFDSFEDYMAKMMQMMQAEIEE